MRASRGLIGNGEHDHLFQGIFWESIWRKKANLYDWQERSPKKNYELKELFNMEQGRESQIVKGSENSCSTLLPSLKGHN